MSHELKLQFYRNSRNARKLKRIAEGFSFFLITQELDEPCWVMINDQCTTADLKNLNYFWGIVRKYKDTVMFADGKMLTKEQSETVFAWIRCCCNKEFFPDQQDYCCISPGIKELHGWGCKCLHSVLRHRRFGQHQGVFWYKLGPFDGIIQFIDKQDIKDKLEAEATAKCLQLCPLFSLERAFQYVDQLPDQLDPRNDSEWVYIGSEHPESKGEVIGIEPKPVEITAEY